MKSILFFLIFTMILSCSLSSKETLSLPYKSNFTTIQGWDLGAKAILDQKEKAVKFSNSGSTWLTSDRLISKFLLPIKPNRTYTISLKIKTDIWPPPSVEVSGSYYSKDTFFANSLGSIVSNSKTGIWEESTVYIDIPNNQSITKFKLRIIDLPKKGINGNIWIKDISFDEGFHTTKKRPIKKSFNGSITKVDELGNIEILQNGKFKPFFPIGIYTDNKRSDWNIYKKQGFNLAMWTDNAHSIKRAKDAGLYSSMQLVQYIIPVDDSWIPQSHEKKILHLKKTLKEIKDSGLSNNLLFYYIDNEFYHLKKSYTQIVDIVKEQDKNMHPLYMLNGTYALARKYNKRVNFTGTYVAEDRYETDRTNAFVTLNETENQIQPAIIAQINRGVGKNFRAILFGAIAKGARGMAFWRDGDIAGDITTKPWWDDLPNIAKEIDQLMPLIRANQHTSFTVVSDDEKIIFGTRMVDNIAYIIFSNPTKENKRVIFTISNLPYKIRIIEDYFDHKSLGSVDGNKLILNISAQDSKVIILKN